MKRNSLTLLATLALSFQPCFAETKASFQQKMNLGQMLYFNGNVDLAIRSFKKASSMKPDAFEPHLNLVNIYVQKKDFNSAIEEAREGLKLKPKHRDLHLILGNLLRANAGDSKDADEAKKQLEEAVAELERAGELGAKPASIHSTLAVVHVQRGDLKKSLFHVDKALALSDKNPDAHLIRAILKFKEGDKSTAMNELDLSIKQKDKNAEARSTKADMLYNGGQTEEALEEYKKALLDEPKYHQAMVGIANILISQKKWDDALDRLEKAQEIKPGDANIIYSIAICLEKLGKPDMAIPKFQEGLLADQNQSSKNQILQHLRDLQQRQFMNIPPLMNISGNTSALTSPGANLFGSDSQLFGESFKDLIKIKKPETIADDEKSAKQNLAQSDNSAKNKTEDATAKQDDHVKKQEAFRVETSVKAEIKQRREEKATANKIKIRRDENQ